MAYRYLKAPHSDTAVCCNQSSDVNDRIVEAQLPSLSVRPRIRSLGARHRGVNARRPGACNLEHYNHSFEMIYIDSLMLWVHMMVVIRDRTEVVVSFTDFLLVAIHNILYERVICPSNSFLLARRYSLKFIQSRHPQVCEHIIRVVDAVMAELLTRMINAIAVLGLDGDKLLDRIVFDFSNSLKHLLHGL